MVTVELSCGFNAVVDENVFSDNYELTLDVAKFMESTSDTSKIILNDRIQEGILGAEQKKALLDHLRKETGKIAVVDVANVTAELIRGGTPKKS